MRRYTLVLLMVACAYMMNIIARGEDTRARNYFVKEFRQGLTLVHNRAQLEQLRDTFLDTVALNGGQKSSG
jgi:hypothetical protein